MPRRREVRIAARFHQSARDLLLNTDLPLVAVAERAGFKHQEYMGAVLKARLGTTPARLRRVRSSAWIPMAR